MDCIFATKNTKEYIWPLYITHFKSETTIPAYLADITEFMNFTKKDFLQTTDGDVSRYYEKMKSRVKSEMISPATMAKKFRVLHSFASYISENRKEFQVPREFADYFYEYIPFLAKQEKYAKSVSVEEIDKLLCAAEEDIMVYTIITLLHRVGLSSTEIVALSPQDFAAYDNGVYVKPENRQEPCFVPEDAFVVLEQYLAAVKPNEFLFFNKKGNPLNTMAISRMMKKYTAKAGIPPYSAENIRNTCGFILFSYGATPEQVASQMGVTQMQIKRYKNIVYRESIQKTANNLVKLRVEPPKN